MWCLFSYTANQNKFVINQVGIMKIKSTHKNISGFISLQFSPKAVQYLFDILASVFRSHSPDKLSSFCLYLFSHGPCLIAFLSFAILSFTQQVYAFGTFHLRMLYALSFFYCALTCLRQISAPYTHILQIKYFKSFHDIFFSIRCLSLMIV